MESYELGTLGVLACLETVDLNVKGMGIGCYSGEKEANAVVGGDVGGSTPGRHGDGKVTMPDGWL